MGLLNTLYVFEILLKFSAYRVSDNHKKPAYPNSEYGESKGSYFKIRTGMQSASIEFAIGISLADPITSAALKKLYRF